VSLSLGLRFDNRTSLTGMYRDSLRYGSAFLLPANLVPRYARAYNVDYKRELGEAFHLLLGGSYMENRAEAKDPKDIKAEAKVGVRF
jgi:hypothetical protein